MAYEGQIAGVGDRPPGRRLRGAAIRFMQRRSAAELAERRGARSSPRSREFAELEIVNGGGTGSLELTAAEEAVTEVTAGSGFYAPALFDHYSRFTPHPRRRLRAADRAQARRRRSRPRSAAATSPPAAGDAGAAAGPLAAAGPAARRRGGRRRGADAAARRRRRRACAIGDRVYLRHAKAGELCERFDALHLVEGERDRRRGPHLPRRRPGLPLADPPTHVVNA